MSSIRPLGIVVVSIQAFGLFGHSDVWAEAGVPVKEVPVKEASAPKAAEVLEVVAQGKPSEAVRLRGSAEAVSVVDSRNARRETRDLGEVLAGVDGVSVRRGGGLGSSTRFSLNGLYDNQIRFFLDGIPLDVAGATLGISSLPVSLVERVEIYRGVLPVRFGADALGGAVNLVGRDLGASNAEISYQRGSFGTHRASVLGQYHHAPSGVIMGMAGWLDWTRNDYLIDVEVADKKGQVREETVRRFHDAYQAYGGVLTLGVLDRPWAKRLSLQLFGSTFEKEVQHDAVMSRPFGEAKYDASAIGATLRYEQMIKPSVSLSMVASGSRSMIRFLDISLWNYDWYGRRVAQRNRPGELFREPRDTSIFQDSYFGRVMLQWQASPRHSLRVASTARFFGRTGRERGIQGPNGIDPQAGRRDLLTLMTGIEHEWNAFPFAKNQAGSTPENDRLQNIGFLKHYLYDAKARDVLVLARLASIDTWGQRFGVGDGLRVRLLKSLSFKGSYELATRIPQVDELFGNGQYVVPNIDLKPETSHNVNVGIIFDSRRTPRGAFASEVNGFLRQINGLIAATPETTGLQYKNVEGARALGVEGSFKWISPKGFLTLEGNGTWQDVRNQSTQGAFAKYDGEKIPNRPWLFANVSTRLQWRRLLVADDVLSPFYFGHYVHEFFRNWESIGDREFKAIVPSQLYHTLGVSYASNSLISSSITFEVDNVTNEKIYDFFGVQRPGRSVSVKVTSEL